MLLYCIAHAGSSAMNFLKWQPLLLDSISIVPLELAGRGVKYNQSFYENFTQAVQDLFNDFKKTYNGEPFALFGHSLGGWLVYELYYNIKKNLGIIPNHIFFSGLNPPNISCEDITNKTIKEDVLSDMINNLHGDKIDSSDTDMLRHIKNVLKNDLILIKKYNYVEKQELIQPPITVLSGTCDDKTTNQLLLKWKLLTNNRCTFCKIEGDHFFPFNNIEETVSIVNSNLYCL